MIPTWLVTLLDPAPPVYSHPVGYMPMPLCGLATLP